MTGWRALAATAVLSAAVAGCLPRPKAQPEPRLYDFGPPPATTAATSAGPLLTSAVLVRLPEAPLWLDSTAIVYRLGYDEPARIRSYAYSRWVGSPMRLLGELLRRRVAERSATVVTAEAGLGTDEYLLQLQVDEFSQFFDAPGESRVVIRGRASLLRHGTREVAAQRGFTVERPAPSADAEGAVQGLADASRELTDRVLAWLAEMLPRLVSPSLPSTEPRPSPDSPPAVHRP
jgi:cholesterol transport system auxiliary component